MKSAQVIGAIHLARAGCAPISKAELLEPVLGDWWQPFSGPFLYYPGRRYLPAPLRAFIDFVRATEW